ncbi:unnamed protein product [Owenia fusiformis]|uniref:E3 ubiquitin-protein ligase n=1 Tax=Owenia fusiformis TaxID=6347 RepID=A0A8S4NVA2_OWEFU|nr:unnamed protein product [Owenia fusiformis]
MAGVIEEQIKETLTCKICFQVLNNPKAFPCLHTYCCGCLGKLMIEESDEKTVKCPECRQVHTVPEKGVGDFKVNFTTKTLVEIFNAAATDDTPKCISCNVNRGVDINAVTKCLECNKHLCKACMGSHNEFVQGHTTVDLTGDKSHDMQRALKTVKDRTIHCPKHNIPLQIYCKVDRCVVCASCYAISHSGHECVDIREVAEENVQQIQKLLKYGDDLVEHYETAIHDTHKTKHKMETEMNDAVRELTNDMNAAIQHIRDTYTQNMKSVTEKRDASTKQTIAHLGHLELQKTLVQSTLSQLSTVKDYGHCVELANMTIEINSKLKQWKNVPTLDFNSNFEMVFYKGKLYNDRIVFATVDEGPAKGSSKDTKTHGNQENGGSISYASITSTGGVARLKTTRDRAHGHATSPPGTCVQCEDETPGQIQMDCKHWYCFSCKDYLAKDPTVSNCFKCTQSPKRSPSVDDIKEEDKCIICLGRMIKPKKLDKCGHSFCTSCIDKWLKEARPQCPVCGVSYGKCTGNQPKGGKMTTFRFKSSSLPGYGAYGYIEITYDIPAGIQEEIHPSPGKRYRSVHWTAYLPDNKEGNEILGLLRKAFVARLIFTIGQSRTRGTEDVVTWNDIHHKTKIAGGPFGYPDPGYLRRVREELADKGIK